MSGLRVAFVAGLLDKKLAQKLLPLLLLEQVDALDLYRRAPFAPGNPFTARLLPHAASKFHWVPLSPLGQGNVVVGELEKAARLIAAGGRYDLIVGCFQQFHGIWAHLAGRLRGARVVQLVITDVGWNLARRWPRHVMLHADGCGVRGPASTQALRAAGYGGPVEVIHNPIDLPREPLALTAAKRYDLVAVGNNRPVKDYPWLIEVLAEVKRRRPRLRAALVGSGLAQALGPRLAELGLADAVDMPGHLGEEGLAEVYAASRALILTSRLEGLPMVALEAMAMGMPVVASRVGELPWLISEGREGRFAPHGDTAAMAGAVLEVLEDESRRQEMALFARGRIEALLPEFAPKAIGAAWARLIRGALS